MIKANELRLENLVLYKGEALPIYSIDRAGLSFSRINDIQVNKKSGATLGTGEIDFEPILLTPEILEKCGFKRDYTRESWHHMTFVLDQIVLEWLDEKCGYNGVCQLSYLHQRQNLYFVLTGEELTIKQ